MGFLSRNQDQFDASRDVWQIVGFPTPLKEDRLAAWLRSTAQTIKGAGRYYGIPTIVLEVVASPEGIHHLIRLPKGKGTYLINQLRASIPGIECVQITEESTYQFTTGAELKMHNRARKLVVADVTDFANRVLASMQGVSEEGDQLVLQWIITHAKSRPVSTNGPLAGTNVSLWGALMGNTAASAQEVADRQAKQTDQMFLATGRIGARSNDLDRAQWLVANVVDALTSEAGAAYFKPKPVEPTKLSRQMEFAETPLLMSAELSTTELMSVMAWPLGSPKIAGLASGLVPHMPVPSSVPSEGIVLGYSTMPGPKRLVAIDETALTTHVYVGGGSGVGKTTLFVNMYRQAVERKHGAIVIEYAGNMIRRSLNQVPPDRLDDVVVLDFGDTSRSVPLNILQLGPPDVIASQLSALFEMMFPENKSIYAEKLLTHIIPALQAVPDATIADIPIVANPQGPAQKRWVAHIIGQQKDPMIKRFLESWMGKDDKERTRDTQGFDNRIWKLLTPLETRYPLTQEGLAFNPKDIIENNRLLFVDFAGISEQAASLIGSLLVSSLWRAARTVRAERSNLMFIDEFQYFSRLNGDFEDMLAVARQRNLGLVLATQYIERLPTTTQDAIAANARTKIVFQSSPKSARLHRTDFADPSIPQEHFQNLQRYDALARINTPNGMSKPLTMHTFDDPEGYDLASHAIELSRSKYGGDPSTIETDEQRRRRVNGEAQQSPRSRPNTPGTADLAEDDPYMDGRSA
ncbi:type IV secretory system conjugative DNA transfer family protein [Rhodococcus pyridinivorans]|uniref:type IV secretory system conjugative DNA transfer family protein n=1 Tax=Rhodococcus pyridinivorans TaxID=103816 RepID=UPI00280C0883|nr:type IV secretory system conjugative DNA transfer family protein [Rhodococcus pyridinivorans]WMM74489.1 type IV secretory system conjugative DNA transfer family protein [Rhodococcus pyridinivorans]